VPDVKLAVVYFSATNVTRTYANLIAEALSGRGAAVQPVDVTAHSSRCERFPVERFDAFVFGFPVFADFAPSVMNEWIPTLDGLGRRCVLFFTYGGRTTGYAHFHTKLLLEQAGFQVLFSAEFLGRHSFNLAGWSALPERPDEGDYAVAREFAALAVERFTQDAPPAFALQKPFGYHASQRVLEERKQPDARGWCHPVRSGSECSMCRECEIQCPTQAFDADAGLSDPRSCIECMRCVYICPDQVLGVDPRVKAAFPAFLKDWHLTEEMMRAKKSKIIAESWQAAF
jgi:NAD-dependent dihydropyrimidine dehydrogenase PreA subunit/flavodoxin